MQEKMKKSCKSFLIVALIWMLLTQLSIGLCDAGETTRSPGLVFGTVYYSADGLAKIYEGTNWSCINIIAYCIDEYRNGTVDLAVDNGSTDKGGSHPDKLNDEFRFDPLYQWEDENFDEDHIAVGECEINGSCYVFITSFLYILGGLEPTGYCKSTEWEPIPSPMRYVHGGTWINISIPKFKNPQKASYGNLTTNADNTIGFAIYRSETNNSWDYLKIGETTYFEGDYYYFKDTNLSPGTTYYYTVAPIAKGGYITYGKSPGVEISPLHLIVVNSPNGGEDWSGNTIHRINYTILSGTPNYTVELYWVNDTTTTFIGYDNQTAAGTYITELLIPKIDSDKVKIRVSVTDGKGTACWDMSEDNFTIDSTPPEINLTTPPHNGSCDPTEWIGIEFTEFMNVSSVKDSFSYTDGTTTWISANGSWDPDTGSAKVILFKPFENFSVDIQYNCTITTLAKDDSDPGNHLLVNHAWSFVAAPGQGNFSVEITYPPNEVYVGSYLVEVKVYNKPDAENRSGGLRVKFYTSSDEENFILADEKLILGMFPDNTTTLYTYYSFPTPGTWYIKVNIILLNPEKDLIEGGKSYEKVYGPITVKLIPKAEERPPIGPGPYVLIALTVVIAIVVALWVIAKHRKEIKKKRFRKEIKRKRF